MKQYLSRQLWMLAILLFASIGNAFGYKISVTWDNDIANVGFQDVSNWSDVNPNESGNEWELQSGKTYQMYVSLHNPMVSSINSVTIGGTEVLNTTFNSYFEGGYYMFEDLSADKVVTIGFDKVTDTKIITVDNDPDKGGVQFYEPTKGGYIWVGNGETELPKGSNIRMIINPQTGWQVSKLTVDGAQVDYDGNYYEFANLSANHEVSIEYAAVATHTITVANYSEVANILNDIAIGDSWIGSNQTSFEFNEGSNVTMRIYCRNNLYSVSISDNDGNPFPLNKNQYGEYEYVFENGSLSKDHTVNIVLTKAATNTITVTEAGNNAVVSFREWEASNNGWTWVEPSSSGVWELLSGEGTKYRMEIYIPNDWVYSLGSVMLDETNDITETIKSENYYFFENLSADHTVAIVVNKTVANTNTITVNYDDEKTYNVEFFNPVTRNYMGANNHTATDLPSGSTIRLMIYPQPGWGVKTLTVDNVDVTASYNGSYYEFANLSANHEVNIEYVAVETQKITVNYDENHTNNVYINGNWVNNNSIRKFNKGSNVTMKIFCEDGYKPVLTIDNGESVIPGKNQYGEYEYVFTNLIADHNVNITYEQIVYHNITVIFENMRAQLNTDQNSEYYISSNDPIQFEKGSDVTLVLSNFKVGYKITSIMDGETDITDAYNKNSGYTFTNLNSDHVVTVNLTDVATHEINVGFGQYSQGTVYLESALTGKEKRTWGIFNAQSDVTMTIEPAIGYEVSSIIITNSSTNSEEEVVETYKNNGFKYVFENLTADYSVAITTQKKSMAGIDPVNFTLDNVGMCTFCSEYDLDFTNVSGITAYIVSGFNPTTGSVALTKVKQAPAGTGLIIKGTPGNYTIPVVETNCYHMNLLTGIVKQTSVPTYSYSENYYTDCVNYTLQTDGVFYVSNDSSDPLAANKAYLQIPRNAIKDATDRPIRIESVLDGDVDGNGVVDIADAVRIVNIVVGKVKP